MATFDPTQLVAGSAFIPAAAFPTTAGILANGNADGYINLPGVVRTGAGVYTLPLKSSSQDTAGLSSNEHHALMTARGATGNTNLSVAWTTAILLTVSTFVVAAATDVDFDITIFRTRRVA